MSVLNNLRNEVLTVVATKDDRKVSDFWLNIGIEIPGPDGEPMFVSLPVGLPLDDIKPVVIKGKNQDWINLAQTKNALLEALQKHAAGMKPGDREVVSALRVEIYRRNEPSQAANDGNPLVANLLAALSSK